MPASVNFEGKILNTKEIAVKLNELKTQNEYDKIADILYQICRDYYDGRLKQDQDPDINNNMAAAELFIEANTAKLSGGKEVSPDSIPFIQNLSLAINKKFYANAHEMGKRNEEFKTKLKAGEFPEAQLLVSDTKSLNKLSHDLTLRENTVTFDASCHLQTLLTGKLINKTFNGKPLGDYFVEKENEAKQIISQEMNVPIDTLVNDFNFIRERDFNSSLGFKYKSIGNKLQDGESPFTDIPKIYKEINDCKTPEELDALESKMWEKIDARKDYERQITAYVNVAKTLYDEFTRTGWDNTAENVDDAYKDLCITLKNFTRIGTDYKYYSPDKFDEKIEYYDPLFLKPSSFITHTDVDNAILNIERSMETVFDNAVEKKQDLEEAGKTNNNPEYDAAVKMISVLQNFSAIKNAVRDVDKYYNEKKADITDDELKDAQKTIKNIHAARKIRKYVKYPELKDDDYIKSVDQTMNNLFASYADYGIYPEKTDGAAEKLAEALRENKRLYNKLRTADAIEDDKLRKNYFKDYEASIKKVNRCIKKCKSYDDNYESESMTGSDIKRTDILKKLSKSISVKYKEQKNIVESVGYDKYIRLHTGTNSSKKASEKKQDVAKIIAAAILRDQGKEFSVKNIHALAKTVDTLFSVSDNPTYDLKNGGKENLLNATKDSKSPAYEYNRLKNEMYGIKHDKYDDFTNDMTKLLNSMREEKGRSREYKNLVEAIRSAAKLGEKTANKTPEAKALMYADANMRVVIAVQQYVKGKETVRFQDKGNDAFHNSMDALAVVSKYTKRDGQSVNQSIKKVFDKVVEKSDRDFLRGVDLEKGYGADRADRAYKIRMAKNNKTKAKEIKPGNKVKGK